MRAPVEFLRAIRAKAKFCEHFKARHILGEWWQGLVAGIYPLVCTHLNIDRFVGLLVPATSPRNQTSLIRGTSRRAQTFGPCNYNCNANYEYTLGDWFPKQVPATSPYDKSLRQVPATSPCDKSLRQVPATSPCD